LTSKSSKKAFTKGFSLYEGILQNGGAYEVRIHLLSFCRGISRLFVKEFVKDGIKKEALRRVPERRKTEMKIVALFSKEPM
jgi:hypothetical protein